MLKKLYHTFTGFFSRSEFTAKGGYIDILKVAYPLVISSATFTIMQFCDRLMLSKHSLADVTAAFPAGILYYTLFCFYFVGANFTSAIVAQYSGAKSPDDCVRAAWNGIYFTLAASVIILTVNPLIGNLVLNLLVPDPQLKSLGLDYFNSLMLSGVFAVVSVPCYAYFNGQGRTAVSAVINTLGCILNIPLNYIFIFGFAPLHIPEMGVFGAGMATTISSFFNSVLFIGYFLTQDQERYPTRKFFQFKWNLVKRLIKFGSPSGMQAMLDVGAWTLMLFMVGRLGKIELGACVLAFSINNIFFMPLTGFADATAIVCGNQIGARRPGAAEKSAYRSWRIALVYMIFSAFLYIGSPELLVKWFAPVKEDPMISFAAVLDMTRFVLLMIAIYNFWDATKFIMVGALRGAGDTKVAMFINSGGAWLILIPTLALMIYHWGASLEAVMIFMTVYGGAEALCMLLRFRSKAWKKIRVIDTVRRTKTSSQGVTAAKSTPVG